MFFSAAKLSLPMAWNANIIDMIDVGLCTKDANYLPEFSRKHLELFIPYSVITLTNGIIKDNPKTYHIIAGREIKNQRFYYSYGVSGRFSQIKHLPSTARRNHISIHRKLSAALRANVQIYNKKKAKYSLKAAWHFDEEIQSWSQHYISLDPSRVPTATLF